MGMGLGSRVLHRISPERVTSARVHSHLSKKRLMPGLSDPGSTGPTPAGSVGFGISGFAQDSGKHSQAETDFPPSAPPDSDSLITIEEVQKALSRSRASVYRYTNTDPRNLNPPFNSKKLNPEYRSDQKDPLLFHPNEVARFARDVLRIKEVTVEVLNSPSTATQQLLTAILEELRVIRHRLERMEPSGNGAEPLHPPSDPRSVA